MGRERLQKGCENPAAQKDHEKRNAELYLANAFQPMWGFFRAETNITTNIIAYADNRE